MRVSLLGFTLVELLVVIAIIAVLLAIFFPMAGDTSKMLDNTICSTNLNQLGKGTLSWCLDNGNKFPDAQKWAWTTGGWAWYVPGTSSRNLDTGLIWPYVGEESAYQCPAFIDAARQYMPDNAKVRHSYSMHESFSRNWGFGQIVSLTADGAKRPGETLFMGEEMPGPDSSNFNDTSVAHYRINNSALGVGTSIGNKIDGISTYHNPDGPENNIYWTGWGHAFFLDGHTELRRMDEHADVLVIAWPDHRAEFEKQRNTR